MTCCARWRSFQRSGAEDSASRRATSPRRAGRSKEHRHAVDALAQSGERRQVHCHVGSALAGSFEAGHEGLRDGCQLAGREADERHAGAVSVSWAARAIAITVERCAIRTFEAVVLADDPLFHDAPHRRCAAFRTRVYRSDTGLRRGFSPFCARGPVAGRDPRRASRARVTAPAPRYRAPKSWACWSPPTKRGSVRR